MNIARHRNWTQPLCFILSAILAAGQGSAAITIPKPTAFAASRFLQQAAFGPDAKSLADVQAMGFSAWIDAQFALDSTKWSPIPDPSKDAKGNTQLRNVQDSFFLNAVNGQDQLRQRVAFALGQIWVVSNVKLQPETMVPYLRLLQKDAFSTYDQIMLDVTLSPAMGHYLDMVNNNKPTPGHGANENYAREILQLFTVGLVELDNSARPKKDNKGNPIPAYDQDMVEGFANAFTGWTYAPLPGANSRWTNPTNWDAPMVPFDAHHDTDKGKKLLGGYELPANQTAVIDLHLALNNIFNNANVGPFVCRQLIQRLVTSNPSDAYVSRIVSVFNSKPRGDMKAVVRAILLDSEARKGDDGSENTASKLQEPVLWTSALLRGLGASIVSPNSMTDYASRMGQTIYRPPTVFNYFLPGYDTKLANNQIYNAPEFQLLSESTAISAADFVNVVSFGRVNGVTIDWTPYTNILGAKPGTTELNKMLDALDRALPGALSPAARTVILNACLKATTPLNIAKTAVYLIGSSWDFQVER